MALIASSPTARLHMRALPRWLPSALVLAACAGFMFFDLKTPPIVMWDESRLAVNALEMHLSGRLSLVTTYGFRPDLWNTKPPLLIWLMDLSMSLFGVSEWSVRLPSMISAVATLALVMSFTRRVTHSWLTGALAAVLLALSVLFFSEHGARTADYEALLCLLTTSYLYVLFFALHRRRPGAGVVMAAAGLVAAAVLTKSVAGLLPGVGVGLYLVVVGRWRRPLQSLWYAAAGVLVLGVGATYFLLREHAAPGYLQAMVFNDVAGRFTSALDRHSGPPWYYLNNFFVRGVFSAGMFAALAPLALLSARGPARLALLFGLCVTAGVLAVLSLSATKLTHYGITTCPWIAIFTAIGAHEGVKALARANARGQLQVLTPRLACGVFAAVLVVIGARSVQFRMGWLMDHEFYPKALYGELFEALSAREVRAVRVVDSGGVTPGRAADGVARDYAPQLNFYRLQARSRGMDVVRIAPTELGVQGAGAVLASCDPLYTPRLQPLGPNLVAIPGCVAVRR